MTSPHVHWINSKPKIGYIFASLAFDPIARFSGSQEKFKKVHVIAASAFLSSRSRKVIQKICQSTSSKKSLTRLWCYKKLFATLFQ
jgi:hypothetical protein